MLRSSAGITKTGSISGRHSHTLIRAIFEVKLDPVTREVTDSVCNNCTRVLKDRKINATLLSKYGFTCVKASYSEKLAAWTCCSFLLEKPELLLPRKTVRPPLSSVILNCPITPGRAGQAPTGPSLLSIRRPQPYLTNFVDRLSPRESKNMRQQLCSKFVT